jgi:hypothetical protein
VAAYFPTVRAQRVGPGENNGRRSIMYFISALFEVFVFCFPGTAQSGAEKAKALPGRSRRA